VVVMRRVCIECMKPLPRGSGPEVQMHRACRTAYERAMSERSICECPPPRDEERFWMGRQCATCKKPFLEDLRPT
jgi:hypothetical protein